MSEIITERFGSILRVQLNRPAKKNAMTSSMYTTLADLLNSTAKDDRICVVLWHGAGDSFCAGNDMEDFVKNPSGPGESPQALLMNALINFDKPLVAAVHGVAVGGNHHADALRLRVCRREREVPNAVLQSRPGAGIWNDLLGSGAYRAQPCGRVDSVGTAFRCQASCGAWIGDPGRARRETVGHSDGNCARLAEKPAGALQACKRLMKRTSREPIEQAMRVENEEFASRVRSADTKEAMTAFLEKRSPNFTRTKTAADTGIRETVSSN